MPILPLPQFEADMLADEQDRETYSKLKAPKTLVVRFGVMKMVGEFPWDSTEKPGCGSKIIVKTHRGTEIGEMLTSTCANSGCSKSVSRKDMLDYIENSGGRDYPFFTDGRALRIATKEDMDRQAAIEQSKHAMRLEARSITATAGIDVKIVDVEPLLGGELLSVYYLSEERVDFRDLVPRLREHFGVRVELKQVGARDEARITADYERCGQYCCCKNFLKVLKPISMKSAKVQKATLDPLKISGRCGRLMCCLRYEDETYETLKKNLPKKKSRVGTPEGDGIVIDSQILTQLVLVDLDEPEASGKPRQVAIPVENLTPPVDPVGVPRMPVGLPPPRSGPPTGARPPQGGSPRRDGPPREAGPREGAPRERGPADAAARGPRDSDRRERPSKDQPNRDQPNRDQANRGQRAPGQPDQRSREQGPRDQRPREQGPRDQAQRDQAQRDQAPRDQSQRVPRPDRPPPPPRDPQRPPEAIDLDDIETDMGDGPRDAGQRDGNPRDGTPRDGGGPDGPRRRRRRRRGGQGRGPGGPGPNAGPNSGPPSGPSGGPPPGP